MDLIEELSRVVEISRKEAAKTRSLVGVSRVACGYIDSHAFFRPLDLVRCRGGRRVLHEYEEKWFSAIDLMPHFIGFVRAHSCRATRPS